MYISKSWFTSRTSRLVTASLLTSFSKSSFLAFSVTINFLPFSQYLLPSTSLSISVLLSSTYISLKYSLMSDLFKISFYLSDQSCITTLARHVVSRAPIAPPPLPKLCTKVRPPNVYAKFVQKIHFGLLKCSLAELLNC